MTGASRGIGAAASVALAQQGFDVVATARTLEEGQNPDGRPLPGSLETTARAVRALGRAARPLRLDLLDPSSIDAALEETRKSWGTIDRLASDAPPLRYPPNILLRGLEALHLEFEPHR